MIKGVRRGLWIFALLTSKAGSRVNPVGFLGYKTGDKAVFQSGKVEQEETQAGYSSRARTKRTLFCPSPYYRVWQAMQRSVSLGPTVSFPLAMQGIVRASITVSAIPSRLNAF